MNKAIEETCNGFLSEIEITHGYLKTSWHKAILQGRRNNIHAKTKKTKPSDGAVYNGETSKVLDLLSEYCETLEHMRTKYVNNFIESLRKEISHYWDRCSYGNKQRSEFQAYHSAERTEELLKEHEQYLKDLSYYHNENKELFKLISRREKLWDEKLTFNSPTNDCSRYENRGGVLLKELKRIQIVERLLPKIEIQVKDKIKKWEKTNRRNFMIDDTAYLDYLNEQKSEYDMRRKAEREARKLAKEEEKDAKNKATRPSSASDISRSNSVCSRIGSPPKRCTRTNSLNQSLDSPRNIKSKALANSKMNLNKANERSAIVRQLSNRFDRKKEANSTLQVKQPNSLIAQRSLKV